MTTATVHVSASASAVMAANIFPIVDEHVTLTDCWYCAFAGCAVCHGSGLVHKAALAAIDKHDLSGLGPDLFEDHSDSCRCHDCDPDWYVDL